MGKVTGSSNKESGTNSYAKNNQSAIKALKFAGNPIFLNTIGKKGSKSKVYTMGTKAPREVIAAGYRALAQRAVA